MIIKYVNLEISVWVDTEEKRKVITKNYLIVRFTSFKDSMAAMEVLNK